MVLSSLAKRRVTLLHFLHHVERGTLELRGLAAQDAAKLGKFRVRDFINVRVVKGLQRLRRGLGNRCLAFQSAAAKPKP